MNIYYGCGWGRSAPEKFFIAKRRLSVIIGVYPHTGDNGEFQVNYKKLITINTSFFFLFKKRAKNKEVKILSNIF